MALTAKLDKATYAVGETMTLTVNTLSAERNVDVPVNVKVSITGLGEVNLSGVVDKAPLAIIVADTARAWLLKSDDGTTAVYTAKA